MDSTLLTIIVSGSIACLATGSMMIAAIVVYKTFSDSNKIKKIEQDIHELDQKTETGFLNGKEIETVLVDHKKYLDSLLLLTKYSEDNNNAFKNQYDRIKRRKQTYDRHFLELEIFSQDISVRDSALQELSAGVGNWDTLDMLNQFADYLQGAEKSKIMLHSNLRAVLDN